MNKDKKITRKKETVFLMVAFLLILISGYYVGFADGKNLEDKTKFTSTDDNFIFLCNPHYFGKWDAPPCNSTFINATGNYCDGELVCQNLLKGEKT